MKPIAFNTAFFRRVRWLRAWALAAALLAAAVPAAQAGCLAVLVGNSGPTHVLSSAWQRASLRSTATGCCALGASLAAPSPSTPRAASDEAQDAAPAIVGRAPIDAILPAGQSRPWTAARADFVGYSAFLKHTRLRL